MVYTTTKNFMDVLKGRTGGYHRVVPLAGNDRLLLLDFTENNPELTTDVVQDTESFSDYINRKLDAAGALYGIGGYNEHRTVYSRSAVFGNGGEEPRRLHLGVDIWGDAGTPVYAPLEGSVHSFAYNDAFGDYGATLILQHEQEGFLFHTLYGHLSLHSIQDIREGQDIEKGQWIASFGAANENGGWPPHLHFQIVIDMEGKKGDYPGVCKLSEREKYLANCPDPDLILGLMQYIKK
jgi:peptidoglycan LD-endopeptidase LytH